MGAACHTPTVLTNREIASLIVVGLAVIGVFAFGRSLVGWKDVSGLLRLVFRSRLTVLWLGYLAYAAVLVLAARALGVWTPAMAAETVVIVLGVGLPMLWSTWDLRDARALGREVARRTVGPAVLMAAYVNLVSFSVPAEVLLQACAAWFLLVQAVAERDPTTRLVGRICGGIAAAMGLVAVWHTTAGLLRTGSDYDWGTTGRIFAMSLWFPLALAPLIYSLGYVSTCAAVTLRNTEQGWRQPRIPVRLAVLLGLRFSLRLARDFRASNVDVGRARTYRQASADVASFRASRGRAACGTSAESEP